MSDSAAEKTPEEVGYLYEGDWDGPLVATAIHAGNGLTADVAGAMVLPGADRFREEDPFTERIIARLPARLSVLRSRFEADLNRDREKAVYRRPEDAWGLQVWRDEELDPAIVEGSLAYYDGFYAELAERLDALAERGRFVVYDVHSYNHRRGGADAEPDPAEENPTVNLGTASLDPLFRPVADAFTAALRENVPEDDLDVRENVKFSGGALTRWVNARYPGVGCALAIEFKKTFMDEWTAVPDELRISQLATALAATAEPVLAALEQLP